MRSPRLAGLVLAAGSSERMGPDRNKLVEEVRGRALVTIAVDALLAAGLERVFVVTGSEPAAVEACLGDREVELLHHAGWSAGMGATLAAAVRRISDGVSLDGLLVCVGDLPGLRPEWARALVTVFEELFSRSGEEEAARALVVAAHAGRAGHPVLLGSAYFEALAALEGDRGGRAILEAHRDRWIEVETGSDAIFRDVDTPAELEAARRGRD